MEIRLDNFFNLILNLGRFKTSAGKEKIYIMGKHTDKDEELHNKGQSDCSNNKYDPPHGIISSSNSYENAEEQEAYNTGWNHANDQK